MRYEHRYEFEELPLVARDGNIQGGFIAGAAHIDFEWEDAGYLGWDVSRFEFAGYEKGYRLAAPLTVTAKSDPALFAILSDAMRRADGDHIEDLLMDALADEGICPTNVNDEHRTHGGRL